MKKVVVTLLIMSSLCNPCVAKAKTIFVKENKVTSQFLARHQSDTIYTFCKGIRVKKNGDGIGKCGGYIKFDKGKVGEKYTLVLRYRKGATELDDIVSRFDMKGWS